MADVKFQVLGYRDFNRKSDGKHMTIVTCSSQCTEFDNSKGTYGLKTTDFFLPDEYVGSLKLEAIGQEFVPEYGMSGFGRPILVSYKLQPWK